jgi:uncharacterized NAD(P)/FAD-binding protein YdhS
MTHFDVAVVGAGAAGTCLVTALLRRDSIGSVLWLTGDDSVGVAYTSRFDSHLLNVPVARMSAFADQPNHFYDWLTDHRPDSRYTASDFVPRRLYGSYLLHLRGAAKRDGRVSCVPTSLLNIEAAPLESSGAWRLRTSDGQSCVARRVALATGLPQFPSDRSDADSLIRDPWHWLTERTSDGLLPTLNDGVLILGSGLTAMDVIVGLRDLGFAGRIRVKSRSGQWSQSHAPTQALTSKECADFLAELRSSPTSRSYVRIFRRHAVALSWRALFDAIRPSSQTLWEALSTPEKQRFLRHVFAIWNRHRHRAPPQIAERVRLDDQVVIEKGRWTKVDPDSGLIVDCRGFGLTVERRWPPYVTDLLEAGALEVSPVGVGLITRRPDSVTVLGALRFGAEFECTAVPEIRLHASTIAESWA